MLPFEFIVEGPPLSHQTRNRARPQEWKEKVRAAAAAHWPIETPPIMTPIKFTVVYYHEGEAIRLDNDNMVKPLQDALNRLIYADDRLITDTIARKTSIDGEFRVRYWSAALAEGFTRGREFLHITIEAAPDHRDTL